MKKKQLIGRRIKEIRKRKGLSQDTLAEKADTSPNYLSRMERGTENPTLDMLIKISEGLEVEMSELFDFSHQESTKALKELLKKLASQVDGDANLKMAVRLLRVITR